MTKLYKRKDGRVRVVEIADDDAVRLLILTSGGYEVGEPPIPKVKRQKAEKPIEPTEGEELDSDEVREPVLATHAPVTTTVPDVEVDVIVDPPLTEMSMKELRSVARENEITVPFDVRTKKDIAAHLAEKLKGGDND